MSVNLDYAITPSSIESCLRFSLTKIKTTDVCNVGSADYTEVNPKDHLYFLII